MWFIGGSRSGSLKNAKNTACKDVEADKERHDNLIHDLQMDLHSFCNR